MQVVRLTKIYLNEVQSKICLGKHLSYTLVFKTAKRKRYFITNAYVTKNCLNLALSYIRLEAILDLLLSFPSI
jgi:hypothetical protein